MNQPDLGQFWNGIGRLNRRSSPRHGVRPSHVEHAPTVEVEPPGLVTPTERDWTAERACSRCGLNFAPRVPNQRFCSPRCRDLDEGRDPDREGPPYPRVCEECGEAFEARRPEAVTCSPACRTKRSRRRRAAAA